MKRFFSLFIKIAVMLALSGWLFYRFGTDELVVNARDMSSGWLVLALVCMTASNFAGALQWNMILKNLDVRIPYVRALSFYYTGLFFNNFLLGFIGGDFVRIYDITKTSGKNAHGISTVFLDRLIGVFTLSLLACIALIYTSGLIKSNFPVFTIVIVLCAVGFVFLFLYSKPFAKKFEAFGKALLPKRFHGKIREIYNSLNFYGNHPALLSRLFLISLIVQTARILVHYCTAQALGVDIGMQYYFLFIPVIAIVLTLPITPGGIGVRENLGAQLFSAVGVSGASAAVFEFFAYLVNVAASLPGGIMFIIRNHETKGE